MASDRHDVNSDRAGHPAPTLMLALRVRAEAEDDAVDLPQRAPGGFDYAGVGAVFAFRIGRLTNPIATIAIDTSHHGMSPMIS